MRADLLPLLLLGTLTGCSFSEPVNTVSEELTSPDKTKRAVLFCRDAGATTGFNTQLSILSAEEKLPNEPGNALILDHGSARVAWKTDGGLLVTLDRGSRVFKREPQVRGVSLEYRQQ
jgi:hypothetical protein